MAYRTCSVDIFAIKNSKKRKSEYGVFDDMLEIFCGWNLVHFWGLARCPLFFHWPIELRRRSGFPTRGREVKLPFSYRSSSIVNVFRFCPKWHKNINSVFSSFNPGAPKFSWSWFFICISLMKKMVISCQLGYLMKVQFVSNFLDCKIYIWKGKNANF